MFSAETSIEQGIFIDTWNAVVKKLKQLKYPSTLPLLPAGGVCNGLCFCLLDYLQNDREDEFFLIYTFVCKSDPEKLAFWLVANSDCYNVFIDKLFEVIYKVAVLQKNQHILPCNNNDANQSLVGEKKLLKDHSNFYRVNGEFEKFARQALFCANDITTPIDQLTDDNTAIYLSIYRRNTKVCHGILVYRKNDSLTVFDPNVGDKVTFETSSDAARFIIYHVNLAFISKNEMPYFFSLSKNYPELHFFSDDFALAANKIKIKNLSHSYLTFKEQKNLADENNNSYNYISKESMRTAVNQYIDEKKLRYFGLPWLTCHPSIKKMTNLLFFVEDDKKRMTLATDFVSHDESDFANHLLKQFPQLRKPK